MSAAGVAVAETKRPDEQPDNPRANPVAKLESIRTFEFISNLLLSPLYRTKVLELEGAFGDFYFAEPLISEEL